MTDPTVQVNLDLCQEMELLGSTQTYQDGIGDEMFLQTTYKLHFRVDRLMVLVYQGLLIQLVEVANQSNLMDLVWHGHETSHQMESEDLSHQVLLGLQIPIEQPEPQDQETPCLRNSLDGIGSEIVH